MATNIDIQQQLNDLLEQQSKIMEAQAKMMKSQISLAQDLVDSLSKINYKGVAEDVENISDAVDKAQATTSKFGGTNQTVFEQVTQSVEEAAKSLLGFNDQTLDAIEKVGKLGFVAGSAMSGFIAGLKFTGNSMRTVLSLGTGMLGFLGDLAASIIAIPFKMLSGLISMADTGGSNELAQALEDIRKEFGALHTTAGKAIIDISRSMKGELANSGLSVYRVMGNLAERLKAVAEWAKQLGPLFEVLAPQIVKNSEAFAAYTKGLGLTDAGLKAVGARAFATGQDITEIQRQMANYSIQLGKSFGLSSKMISRDMGEMMADFKHFGSLAPQQLAQVSVFARKLGVDIKALVGVIDKFDNFEDAAAGAAHLSQAFGLNVDALELMKAQNPAERVEMLRKAFFNAGRSVESMTRQERSLLAQQSGVGDDALDLVFSLKNQATSYADIQKKGGAAHKQQLTQAQAMKGLADSIERLVKSGSAGAGGFFDRFIQGFTVGIRRSTEFRQLMYAIQKSLMVVFNAGIRVGRMFVDMFPGVKNIIKGLGDMFNPAKFRDLMKKVQEAFRGFFDDMTKNPQTALTKLMDKLKKGFFEFFQSNSAAGRRVLDGFRSFFVALAQIGASMLKLALKGITTGVRYIVDLLQGNVSLPGMGGAGGAATGFIGEILGPIIDALKEAWPPLWTALKNLFHEVLYNHVGPFLLKHAPLILGLLFGPSVLGMVGRTFTSTLITMFLGSLGRALTSGTLVSRGTSMITKAFGGLTSAAARTAQAGAGVSGGVGAQAAPAINATNSAVDSANKSRVSAGTIAKLALLTLVIGVGLYFLVTKGLVPLAKSIQENHITGESIRSAALTMVAAALAMTAMGGALALLNVATRGLNAGSAMRMLAGIAIIGLVAAGMAFEGKHIINYLKDISPGDLGRSVLAMGAIGTFFLAAAGITAIAALVGVIAFAGGGLGAVAIAAGLLAIGVTIEVMAREGLRIMNMINGFRPSPGFMEKTKAFAAIMSAVGAFAGNIATIIEATRPSFTQFLFGNPAEEQRKTLASVQAVVATISGGLIGIIRVLRPAINQLAGSESQLKAAEALGSLLQGVSALGQALAPPSQALAESSFMHDLMTSGDRVVDRVHAVQEYVTSVGWQLRQFLHAISSIITGELSAGITVEQQRALEAIPALLGGLGTFARVLMPSPTLIQELNKGSSFSGQLTNIASYVSTTLGALRNLDLFGQIGGLIRTVVDTLKGENLTKAQLELVKAGLPVLSGAMQGIGSIANAITNLAQNQTTSTGAIFQATQFIQTLISSIGTSLPTIIRNMVATFAGFRPEQLRSVVTGMNALKGAIESVAAIGSGNLPSPEDLRAKFFQFGAVLDVLQVKMMDLDQQFAGTNLASLGNLTQDLVKRIHDSQIERVSGAIAGMVRSINATGAALKALQPINIDTQLKSVAGNLGLGAAGNYRIDNRNFTIVVNFSVKIDQPGLEALELALTTRPRSTINTSGGTE